MIAIILLGTLMNIYGAQRLPVLEGVILFIHIFGFFCIIIPLWVLAPKASASEVFGKFDDFGDWASVGAVCFVGSIAAAGSFGVSDAAVRLAEETKDAGKSVRRYTFLSILRVSYKSIQDCNGIAAAAHVLLPSRPPPTFSG